MTSEELFDRIYGVATTALWDMPKDTTISMEAFAALTKIKELCLETPTAMPANIGKYEEL